jgi:hypothetical protein
VHGASRMRYDRQTTGENDTVLGLNRRIRRAYLRSQQDRDSRMTATLGRPWVRRWLGPLAELPAIDPAQIAAGLKVSFRAVGERQVFTADGTVLLVRADIELRLVIHSQIEISRRDLAAVLGRPAGVSRSSFHGHTRDGALRISHRDCYHYNVPAGTLRVDTAPLRRGWLRDWVTPRALVKEVWLRAPGPWFQTRRL